MAAEFDALAHTGDGLCRTGEPEMVALSKATHPDARLWMMASSVPKQRESVTRSSFASRDAWESSRSCGTANVAAAHRAALRYNRSTSNSSRNLALLHGQSFGSSTSFVFVGLFSM